MPPPHEHDDDSASSCSEPPAEQCEDDRCNGPQPPVWHCVDCDSSYCSDCWALQGPHKRNKKGRDGVPHEKTNPVVVRRLKSILNPTRKADEIQRMHEEDGATKWFGVARDLTGRPNFEDYGRYASLLSSISPIESMTNRYPQLVSFIGVTNAGKSTLIKLLVNHDEENNHPDRASLFPSPIVGSVVNDTLPTSGDVHLYADPATHAEQLPILYADCEGFEGGERTPLGARARRRRSDPSKAEADRANVHSRVIEWAHTEEQRQREYAVTALYPRLLYTFSDCVVFVLRNPKTFQSAVLTKLLEWGVAALEKSINQPALPHCIVAVNGTDPSVDDREWDVNYATQSLLMSVHGALDYVEGVPRFRELAEHWRSLGKHIYTVEDLILRYYSSFKVVRIPSKPRYMTINEQIGKLHDVIKSNCEDSFRTKRRARMLTNADELNVYLQSGFDHFTTHLDIPFNFMQISLLRNPIPNDFGGHILQLCSTISSQQPNHQPGRVAWMFEKLSVMLSSCVLLDCARFRKGRVDQLFANYEKFFDYAMGEYLELHYPCSYVSADGTRQCMLVKARHLPKGHQDEKGIIAAGDYEAAFDSTFLQQWKGQLRSAIEGIHRDFSYELEQVSNEDVQAIPEERIALDLHIEYLNQFYESVGPATAICSHATCFCCLMDVPEHPLPCGHVLCTACIKAYGKQGKSFVTLTCCPLHRESTKWAKPALIKFKPANAGVRVLSLDGGGIRGIVQLEVLRAIEQAMGGFLPIQAFFDLIVGTGTGGLLAVAMSLRDRSIDSCLDMFSVLCDHAFTPRLKGIPVISHLAQVFGSGPKYKTKPLYAALKTAFTEEDELFGGVGRMRMGARVALTASSVTGRESILLASYRRPEDLMPTYQFERPHEPEMELKIWQSVAAALATPTYFRPFNFHSKTYLDGGLRCSNPSLIADRERRLIWPDVGEPDLFLSLGTGQNRITVLQKLSERPNDGSSASITTEPGEASTESRKSGSKWRSRRVDDVLDAEVAWADFRAYAVKERSESKGRRFIRFNPDLDKEPPAGDSKNDMEALQVNVRKRLQTPHRLAALRNVAHRLVASSFYLDLLSKATGERSEQVCSAVLSCRFEDGSREMAGLGRILQQSRTDEFEPYFLIKPDAGSSSYLFKIPITGGVIRGMIDHAVFGLPNVYLPLRDESKPTSITLFLTQHDGLEPDGFPISGFPRVVLGEAAAADRSTRRPGQNRASTDQPKRQQLSHIKARLDADSISLNGNAPPSRGGSSDESWQDAAAKLSPHSSTTSKMSLADIIAQHQGQGSSIRQRTNRFWTYIGNNHMAQHPEMYSPEELAKFVSNSAGSDSVEPVELASSSSTIDVAAPPYTSPNLSQGTTTPSNRASSGTDHSQIAPQELESRDKLTMELREQRSHPSAQQPQQKTLPPHPSTMAPISRHSLPQQPISPPRPASMAQPTRIHSSPPISPPSARLRDQVASVAETEFEEDDAGSAYSGREELAQASPVVQVRIDSVFHDSKLPDPLLQPSIIVEEEEEKSEARGEQGATKRVPTVAEEPQQQQQQQQQQQMLSPVSASPAAGEPRGSMDSLLSLYDSGSFS
nr:calcium-independent phospholipase a2-gamma [Quercus suber]